MTGFFYYLPGLGTAPSDELLKSAGLFDIVGPSYESRGTTSGPDSTAGQVVGRAGLENVGFWPHRQTWTKAGKHWIGHENGKLPRPHELKRPELVQGHQVKLGDGQDWVVPIIRSVIRGTALPQALLLNEEGDWSTRPMEAYKELTEDALRVWEWIQGQITADDSPSATTVEEPPPVLTRPELADIACRALGVNYRVSRWEVSLLGLLDELHGTRR